MRTSTVKSNRKTITVSTADMRPITIKDILPTGAKTEKIPVKQAKNSRFMTDYPLFTKIWEYLKKYVR